MTIHNDPYADLPEGIPTGDYLDRSGGEPLIVGGPYDAEMAERAAIQADAENERDGYRD
jgi:hypothetical protein